MIKGLACLELFKQFVTIREGYHGRDMLLLSNFWVLSSSVFAANAI